MRKIYDLRDDDDALTTMPRGMLDAGPIGLKNTHGLIGSHTWWRSLETGTLPLQFVEGEVTGFWPGQWGGGPAEFEIAGTDGIKTKWLCSIDPESARENFNVGRTARVDFVHQERKSDLQGSTGSNVIVQIWLG